MTDVLIIESRNPGDFFAKRSEAETLAKVLQLGDIKAKYLEVVDFIHFKKAIMAISKSVRYVHFSCHGNKDGFELTDGTPIDWQDLQEIVQKRLQNKYLIFSSCLVAKGVKKLFTFDETFCRAIVAPTRKITWSEGLVAYSAFYHRAISVEEYTTQSVKVLNSITEPRTFKCFYNSAVTHA